jgi:hypothetical protein
VADHSESEVTVLEHIALDPAVFASAAMTFPSLETVSLTVTTPWSLAALATFS